MDGQKILAVIQADLQLIRSLRTELESHGFFTLNIARNSQEAILYLRGIGIYNNRIRYPLPTSLILDCQNSDNSDLDVLSWIREQPAFRELPVYLLCPEHHHSHVSCALDPYAFIIDRDRLSELVDALHNAEAMEISSLLSHRSSIEHRAI
jgi:CheY-like chemotaxis protein